MRVRLRTLLRPARRITGRAIRRLGLLPEGQPDGLGEDAALAEATITETVLAIYPDAPANLYQLHHWLPTLVGLHATLPTAIVVQDSRVAAALRRESPLKVYAVGRYSTFEALVDRSRGVGGPRIALYPAHHTRNFQIMRRPDLAHVYLGHGESDKAVSASNQMKAYDFVFASGPSAIDRASTLPFFDADARMLVVGRPQLGALVRGPRVDDGAKTVLYAPTWEGDQPSMHYGSLVELGAAVVTGAVTAGYRVVYRPHPRTGLSNPRHAVADTEVRRLVTAAAEQDPAAGHRVSSGGSVISEFNKADLLVTDVSSLVVDWLPTDRPLVVTALPGAVEAASPLLSAVPRLSPGDDPQTVLDEAWRVGVDPATRAELVTYYLGGVVDPERAFADACGEVLTRHAAAVAAAQRHVRRSRAD